MRDKVINTITEIFKSDTDIYILLGDLGVFQARFANEFDSYRCINYGIMEQSMIGFASGISKAGSYPIVYSIAPFIVERSFEQLKLDFGYNQAKGLIITAGGSFDYNKLGPTHYCPNDVSLIYKTNCHNIVLPWNEEDAYKSTLKVLTDKSYSYMRLSSENIPNDEKPLDIFEFKNQSKEIINIGIGPDSLLIGEYMDCVIDYSVNFINNESLSKIYSIALNSQKINLFAGFNLDFLPEALLGSLSLKNMKKDKKSNLSMNYSIGSKFDTSESKISHLTSSLRSLEILI